jgi:hypothetical protein
VEKKYPGVTQVMRYPSQTPMSGLWGVGFDGDAVSFSIDLQKERGAVGC